MSDKFHHAIDDSPEHAAALGRLIVHWNNLESLLVHVLRYVLMTDYSKSLLIYQEFISVKAKLNLLKRLNQYHLHDKTIKDKIDKLLNQAIILNSQRNIFIHSIWGERYFKHIARQKSISPSNHKIFGNPVEAFTAQDIQSVVEEIAILSQSFLDILNSSFGWSAKLP